MANDRLRAALRHAGLEVEDLAETVQVDTKTVHRWLAGRTPYSRHRTHVAKALDVEEQDLWPEIEPPMPPAGSGAHVELIRGFAHANDAHAPDSRAMIKEASERVELLDFTLLEIVSQRGVTDLLADKAATGCQIRLLISNVGALFVSVTESELNPDYSPNPIENPELAYEIRLARGYIEPLLEIPGIDVRSYLAMRFNTIVRCDEQMLVTLHLYATPGREAPLIHLRQDQNPRLFAQFEQHYDAIWNSASDPVRPQPDLFPDPNAEPGYYEERGALFDDIDDED